MKEKIGNYKIVWEDQLSSTNEYAVEYITENNDFDKTLIGTFKQYSGRGQRTTSWESEEDKNFTVSTLFEPYFVLASEQFHISEVISLGVVDYLSRHIDNVKIKWPNDIYVRDNKIAGILIEHVVKGNSLANSICGIGLNVNQEVFTSDAPNPISMKQITEVDYSLESELELLLKGIDDRYEQLKRGEIEELKRDYMNNLFRRDAYHTYTEGEDVFTARIIDVNDMGQLVLEKRSGEQKTYSFKEVSFVL